MKKSQKTFIINAGVVLIFILSSSVSNISGTITSTNFDTLEQQPTQTKKDDAVITCYVGGIPQTQVIPAESGIYLQELFNALTKAHARNPRSIETQELQQKILLYAEQHDLLPPGISATTILTQLQKKGQTIVSKNVDNGAHPAPYEGTGKEMFCKHLNFLM